MKMPEILPTSLGGRAVAGSTGSVSISLLRRWALAAFALVVMTADLQGIAGPRSAEASSLTVTHASASTTKAVAGSCPRWRVKWRKAAVYERPARIFRKVAVKRRRQVVTGALCTRWTYYNKSEDRWYLAVKARRADDKIGWIRLGAVRRI